MADLTKASAIVSITWKVTEEGSDGGEEYSVGCVVRKSNNNALILTCASQLVRLFPTWTKDDLEEGYATIANTVTVEVGFSNGENMWVSILFSSVKRDLLLLSLSFHDDLLKDIESASFNENDVQNGQHIWSMYVIGLGDPIGDDPELSDKLAFARGFISYPMRDNIIEDVNCQHVQYWIPFPRPRVFAGSIFNMGGEIVAVDVLDYQGIQFWSSSVDYLRIFEACLNMEEEELDLSLNQPVELLP